MVSGNALSWSYADMANGVYLYVVTAKGITRSELVKFVVLR